MEDQFGGRTDDDLFYDDDFEPVDGETTIVANDKPVEISSYYISPPDLIPHPADLQSALAPLAAAAAAGKGQGRRRRKPKSPKSPKPAPPPRGGLALSRFADKPAVNPEPQRKQSQTQQQSPKSTSPARNQDQAPEANSTPPTTITPVPRTRRNNEGKPEGGASNVRVQSGANPRQKLTEEELSAKMEKMKLLSAEKARKFEKAEKDEKQHAEAYARGMEEARRQRAENAEKRRQNEEQRRRLEEERAKNRARKLKAMTMKEGGWDEGKEAAGEDESRRPFRSANGGVRGSKGSRGSGLRGSRFAPETGESDEAATLDRTDTDRSAEDKQPHHSGRGGRSRGNRREGRGGRGGALSNGRSPTAAPVPSNDDFPSLPPSKTETDKEAAKSTPKPAGMAPLPRFAPAIGKWDDEMEFLDEVKNTTATKS